MKKLRVFVTGASGYVGNLLVERLAESPDVESILGIGLSTPRYPFPPKATFRKMDIRSPELSKIVAGHDVVVHTACIVLWTSRMSEQERDDINTNGVRLVAQAAKDNGVRRFVHASSMAVYDPEKLRGQTGVREDFALGTGRSRYYYWNAKAAAEAILQETFAGSDTVLTFLRPIYIIGPRNHCLIASYRRNAVNFFRINPRRQFVHEDDVAAAFVRATLTDMPGAYNVVPDDFLRLTDVWKSVGAPFVPTVPKALARYLAALRWRYFGSSIHPSWVEDMVLDYTGSNFKLRAAGWNPRFGSAGALTSAIVNHGH